MKVTPRRAAIELPQAAAQDAYETIGGATYRGNPMIFVRPLLCLVFGVEKRTLRHSIETIEHQNEFRLFLQQHPFGGELFRSQPVCFGADVIVQSLDICVPPAEVEKQRDVVAKTRRKRFA